MEQSVFSRGDITVIGIRGPLPDWAGLCRPVYRIPADLTRDPPVEERHAFGDEISVSIRFPRRTANDIRIFEEQGRIAPLPFPVRVDGAVAVVCFSAKTEAVLTKALPRWREGREPVQRKNDRELFYIVEPGVAVQWLKRTAKLIRAFLDPVLCATTVRSSAARKMELLGRMCWEMLTWGIPPSLIQEDRRETMVRIVAARLLQHGSGRAYEVVAKRAAQSLALGRGSPPIEELVERYFRRALVDLLI